MVVKPASWSRQKRKDRGSVKRQETKMKNGLGRAEKASGAGAQTREAGVILPGR